MSHPHNPTSFNIISNITSKSSQVKIENEKGLIYWSGVFDLDKGRTDGLEEKKRWQHPSPLMTTDPDGMVRGPSLKNKNIPEGDIKGGNPLRSNGGSYYLLECPSCKNVFVYRGCMCGDRFKCPYCKKKRQMRLRRVYFEALKKFRFPSFLTITMRRKGSIREDIKRLKEGFRLLRRRKEWGKKIKKYFGAIEIAKKQVHLHLIIDCIWWDQREISDIWREITGDFIVYIERVKEKYGSRTKAILETFKYCIKDEEFTEREIEEIREELKGVRLIVASKGLALSSLDTNEISGHRKCPFCGSNLEVLRVFRNENDFIDYLSDFKCDDFYVFEGAGWVKTPIMTYAWRLVNGWI
jgi:transposase-like protein